METDAKNGGEFGPELEGLACGGEVNDGPFRCSEHQRTSAHADAKEATPIVQRCAGCGEPLYGDPTEGVGLVMPVDPMLLDGPWVHYGSGCIHRVPEQLSEEGGRDAD